jgi:hypothetical protein
MEPERRKQAMLAGLTIALAAALYYAWSTDRLPVAGEPSSAGRVGQASARRTSGEASSLRLKDLEGERPQPVGSARNLFRFETRSGPVAPTTPEAARVPAPPAGPPGLPPPPPITLKFIGTLERPDRSERIAVLRDPAGRLMSGREGAVVDGRLRILRIGTESIDLVYLDGRGRQTIRLSGG